MGTVRQNVGAPAELRQQTLRVEVTAGPGAGVASAADSESISVGSAEGNILVVQDPTVSRYHLELSRVPDGISLVDHASTNGTFVGATRVERAIVRPGTLVKIGATTLRVGDGAEASVPLHPHDSLAGIVGRSAAMRRLMAQVERAAASDVSVLVTGESGTGKELVASAIHSLGARARSPFVIVDCGSLAPTLVASELFGHERGAFTGADRQYVGAIERAEGGTIFFDEIGELPVALQATLLGVLQRRRFRRLGGKQELTADIRVVSATNRDLKAEVNAGTFRLDLYYRLAIVTLAVPALRERPDDVALLVERFVRECGHDGPVTDLLSDATIEQLEKNRWPGNVRELRNLVEATMALGEMPQSVSSAADVSGAGSADPLLDLSYRQARASVLTDFEKRYFSRLMERAGGNVSRAARDARVDRSHLIDLLKRHGLKT